MCSLCEFFTWFMRLQFKHSINICLKVLYMTLITNGVIVPQASVNIIYMLYWVFIGGHLLGGSWGTESFITYYPNLLEIAFFMALCTDFCLRRLCIFMAWLKKDIFWSTLHASFYMKSLWTSVERSLRRQKSGLPPSSCHLRHSGRPPAHITLTNGLWHSGFFMHNSDYHFLWISI